MHIIYYCKYYNCNYIWLLIHDKYKPVNAEYYAFDYLNENKLETEIIEDSYIHSSTSKNRKLNSNKN